MNSQKSPLLVLNRLVRCLLFFVAGLDERAPPPMSWRILARVMSVAVAAAMAATMTTAVATATCDSASGGSSLCVRNKLLERRACKLCLLLSAGQRLRFRFELSQLGYSIHCHIPLINMLLCCITTMVIA